MNDTCARWRSRACVFIFASLCTSLALADTVKTRRRVTACEWLSTNAYGKDRELAKAIVAGAGEPNDFRSSQTVIAEYQHIAEYFESRPDADPARIPGDLVPSGTVPAIEWFIRTLDVAQAYVGGPAKPGHIKVQMELGKIKRQIIDNEMVDWRDYGRKLIWYADVVSSYGIKDRNILETSRQFEGQPFDAMRPGEGFLELPGTAPRSIRYLNNVFAYGIQPTFVPAVAYTVHSTTWSAGDNLRFHENPHASSKKSNQRFNVVDKIQREHGSTLGNVRERFEQERQAVLDGFRARPEARQPEFAEAMEVAWFLAFPELGIPMHKGARIPVEFYNPSLEAHDLSEFKSLSALPAAQRAALIKRAMYVVNDYFANLPHYPTIELVRNYKPPKSK